MINQSNIFKKIGYILNELQDQYQFLSENPEQLSELELELFLANANFLSDHVEIVRKLNNNKPLKELPQHVEVSGDDIVQPIQPVQSKGNALIEEIEREELHQDDISPAFEFIINDESAVDKFDFEEKSVEEMFDRTLSREEELIIARKKDLAENPQNPAASQEAPQPTVTPAAEATLIVDKVEEKEIPAPSTQMMADKVERHEVPPVEFAARPEPVQPVPNQPIPVPRPLQPVVSQAVPTQRPTLNDLLAGKGGSNNLAEEMPKPAITDLKRSITLNEKLLYIKDLFNGYNLAYSEAIDLINKMPDFKTADAFLKNNYAVKNNWEAKPSTVGQFYELLKQRFPEG